MRKLILCAVVAAMMLQFGAAYCGWETSDDLRGWWFELWSDTNYRETNFGPDQQYYKEGDFVISQNSSRLGYRFPFEENIYFDPYIRTDLVHDFGKNAWNDYPWNNNWIWGPGVRLKREYKNEENRNSSFAWIDNFTIDAFTEYLTMEESLDGSKQDIADQTQTGNWRAGTSSWLSFVTKKHEDVIGLFGEMWSELAYSSSNFADEDQNDFYILMMQPLVGIDIDVVKPFSIQPYCRADMVYDFGSNDWNKAEWLNNVQYGPGVRLSFLDLFGLKNANMRLYAEWLSIDHFSRVPDEQLEDRSDDDFRTGVEIWLPLGATAESQTRH